MTTVALLACMASAVWVAWYYRRATRELQAIWQAAVDRAEARHREIERVVARLDEAYRLACDRIDAAALAADRDPDVDAPCWKAAELAKGLARRVLLDSPCDIYASNGSVVMEWYGPDGAIAVLEIQECGAMTYLENQREG